MKVLIVITLAAMAYSMASSEKMENIRAGPKSVLPPCPNNHIPGEITKVMDAAFQTLKNHPDPTYKTTWRQQGPFGTWTAILDKLDQNYAVGILTTAEGEIGVEIRLNIDYPIHFILSTIGRVPDDIKGCVFGNPLSATITTGNKADNPKYYFRVSAANRTGDLTLLPPYQSEDNDKKIWARIPLVTLKM